MQIEVCAFSLDCGGGPGPLREAPLEMQVSVTNVDVLVQRATSAGFYSSPMAVVS